MTTARERALASRARALAQVESLLAEHPDLPSRRTGEASWSLLLSGEVRVALPVAVEVGEHTAVVSAFLLRGPVRGRGDAAALHRAMLRRNARLRLVRLALDGDDDAVVVARLPVEGLSAARLGEVLAEILEVADRGFESLVHTAYPGVFPPLAGPRPPVR